MNKELSNLYHSKWQTLKTATKSILDDKSLEIKPANPLLIHIDDEEKYKNANIRLMIFGQETNSWYDDGDGEIEAIQKKYDTFFNEGKCWSYGGAFWNGVNRFLKHLHEKYPNKEIHLTWNNIVKIGKEDEKGFPPDYIYEIEREHFNVISDELEILKPNLALFFTGPNYDGAIQDNFGKIQSMKLPDFTERQISKLKIPGIQSAYRTYHPNYLWRNGIEKYFKTILKDLPF